MKKEDLRAIRTKKFIRDAFLELLKAKPFYNITVKEITENAMCNRNTFYLHYEDKYDLMEQLCDISLKKLEQALYETFKKQYASDADKYMDIAQICLETIESDMDFYDLILGMNKYADFTDYFQELLVRFMYDKFSNAGKKGNRVEIEFCANGMIGVIKYWIKNKTNYSKEVIIKEIANLVIRLGDVLYE